MSKARFRRPDGQDGTYGQWAAEVSAKWNALSAGEQSASRDAAATRLTGQIKAQASDGPTLMHIYDEIGWFGVWPADVVEALSGIKGDVEVHLNSPGGNTFDGLAIYAALKRHAGEVGMVVDGLAASAASFIAMAASPGKLQMTPNGTIMIHDAWAMACGNAAEMAEMVTLLEETSDNVASIYAERSGRTVVECRDLMKAETWAVGQKAVDLGLADSVRRPPANTPPEAFPVAASAAPWQVTIVASEPGPELFSMPQDAPVIHGAEIHAAAADESAWDGPAAMAAASASSDPAAALAAICAGKKAGDPATQAAHALPHHKHPGDAPNRSGVSAALGRIGSTDGLTNAAAARAHLESHQGAMGSKSGSSDHAELPAWLRDA